MSKIVTHYNPKPIPDFRFDWEAREANTEGVVGYGETEEQAVGDLVYELGIL